MAKARLRLARPTGFARMAERVGKAAKLALTHPHIAKFACDSAFANRAHDTCSLQAYRCSELADAVQEFLARMSVSRSARGKVYLPKNLRPLSPGGKMGKYATMVALLVGLSHSAFARDDGRYANDTLKHWF